MPAVDAPTPDTPSGLVEHFFRHEAGRLHGALVRRFGVQHLTLIEDGVQDAMLRALRTWSMGGIPPNPAAWISRVAHNLALDTLRHRQLAATKEPAIVTHLELTANREAPADPNLIRDDTLRLMFVCCHPLIPPDAQAILALKVLGGFTTPEIARAFLSSEAAIEKQLTRTKQRLRDAGVGFEVPPPDQLAERLDGVLATLYLLFNEGYKASSGEQLLREDLCHEAIRLTGLLIEHPSGNLPAAHALLALMLFNTARFPTRVNEQGELLRLEAQDRRKWDHVLIDRALVHLNEAAVGDALTAYHLQAGIAACHCLAPDAASTDWSRILRHYDELMRLKPSPVVALNRAVALAHLHGAQAGLDAIEAMPERARLDSQHLVHSVEGELHWRLGHAETAASHFRRALAVATVGPEQLHLSRMLEQVRIAAASPTPSPTGPAA